MFVLTRSGKREEVSFDRILNRIKSLSDGLEYVNPAAVAQKVCSQIEDGITTARLDEFAAETCATMQARNHPNYGKLAARIVIDNHHKNTPDTFRECIKTLHAEKIVSDKLDAISKYPEIQDMINYTRDFMFDYFGFKTLERAYLLKKNGVVIERPQHMWMRVAIEVHTGEQQLEHFGIPEYTPNFGKIKATYDALSLGYFIHATPTLFNAGTDRPQLSSCFLVNMKDDSISGIYSTLADCAQISKWSGGIGISIHNIRAKNSRIKGTNGITSGLVPMLKVYNDTARYVNQAGKRNGSFAIYLEPWHADIEDFLRLKLNTGAEEDRARDLFYALWIPDLFMKRMEQNKDWSLFCPNECPGLDEAVGDAFEVLYNKYESEGKARKTVSSQKIWQMILDAQIQTGTPYLLYKDACNLKSNQQHLGTIKSSNLCVAPETKILTREGNVEIQSVAGKEVEVWNGSKWSKTTVLKTGENQPVIGVDILVGSIDDENKGDWDFNLHHIECTPYHKFIMKGDDTCISNGPRLDAKDLKRGMNLVDWCDNDGRIREAVVWDVYDYKRTCDTYCFNEPENNAGVFNGVLAGNCAEIVEYTAPDETAVCNLGSVALSQFVKDDRTYDYEALRSYTSILAENLDLVIDRNYYPTKECSYSNFRNRPIGIGVQGLADVFAKMKLSWTSEEAKKVNREIFENMYYAAISTSNTLAKNLGKNQKHDGSPASEGKLQHDLWNDAPRETSYLDWDGLSVSVKEHGLRNSLSIALMPTASTSQILGNNECFEPFTSNLYVRHVLAGDFIIVNKYLVDDLMEIGMWNSEMRTHIIANNGSIQTVEGIPEEIKERYRTAWEIPQKTLINMSRDRAPFVCQSQSLNLFVSDPTYARISSMHVYAWKQGLKTGCYYLRTKAVASAQKFTVEPPSCTTCSA